MVPAEIKIAEALSIAIGSDVYRIQRIKSLNDTVFAYVISYVPCSLAPGLEQYSGKFFILYHCLQEYYGLVVTKVEETIASASSGFLESRLLGVTPGSPLLTFQRTAYSKDLLNGQAQISFLRTKIVLEDHSLSVKGRNRYSKGIQNIPFISAIY